MIKSRELIRLSSSTYDHIVDNGLHEHSNKLNRIMQILAALTVVFIPFQTISSMFGMNVEVPFEGQKSLLPFFSLIAMSSLISVLFLMSFRKLKWI